MKKLTLRLDEQTHAELVAAAGDVPLQRYLLRMIRAQLALVRRAAL